MVRNPAFAIAANISISGYAVLPKWLMRVAIGRMHDCIQSGVPTFPTPDAQIIPILSRQDEGQLYPHIAVHQK
jgi:hypothetical protein